jgi:type I restriction enzyme S subunit
MGGLEQPIVSNTERTITDAGLNSCSTSLLPAKSVILSSRAPIGHVVINEVPMATNQGCKGIVPGPRLHYAYLYHYLRRSRSKLQAMGTGATFKEVSAAKVKSVTIPLPPLPEQKRIAAILDKADGIRRKRQEAIRLTEELLRSAFLEMFGDPVTNPKGWEVKPLQELVDVERGISYGVVQRGDEVPDGVPVARISNFADNVFALAPVVRTARQIADQYQRTYLQGGELVVSIRGTCGRVAVVPRAAAGWNVSREVAVVPLHANINAEFVRMVVLSPGGQRFITGNVRGIAQRGINLADLRDLPVPMPPKAELNAFNRLREVHARVLAQSHAGNGGDEALRVSLTQGAFAGRL